jgi:mono/diheme cytochrome c family protein
MIYRCSRFLAVLAPVLLFVTAVQAAPTEQNDYDAGKTPAQLFESDCGICHNSPAGLSKAPGMGLESFLGEHYTASHEAAAILAKYLQAVDTGQKEMSPARRSKASVKPKSAKESKASETKRSDAQPDAAKDEKTTSEAKKSEPKAGEAVSSDNKPKEKPKADADKPAKSD